MEIDTEEVYGKTEELVRSHTFLIAVGLFVAAFALRWTFRQHGFWIDEGRALMIAKNFLQGNGFRFSPERYMYKHPFMFYALIAFSYLFFGVTALAGVVTTNVLASLTVVAVFLTGKELFNKWAGAAAAVLMMFGPVHVFYSTRVLTDVPGTFFVALTLYLWVRTERREERWSFYATFVAAAFTVLTKMTGIVVLPALFIYYLWKEREKLFFKKKYWYVFFTTVGIYSIWEIRNVLELGFIGIVKVFFTQYLTTGISPGTSGAGIVEGALFHVQSLPTSLGIPAALFLAAGLGFAYIYEDRRLFIPLIFMAVTFVVLSSKALNRYFLPFHPMAMVVAGYGVDRMRELAASRDEKAGQAVFALILVVSAFFMFQSASAMIGPASQGFSGLEEAGKWIRANSAEDEAVVAGSGHQIRFFSDRKTIHAGTISGSDEFYRILTEENVKYVEVDRWERTQPDWYLRIVQQSDAFQPVRGFGPQKKPWVMVYRVNRSRLSR